MENKQLTKDVILYMIQKLGKRSEGRKKMMKLMFLVEHYSKEKDSLTRNHNLGNEFIIYHYGVFSFDIMNDYLELVKEMKISDSFPLTDKSTVEVELPNLVREQVDFILNKFGDMPSRKLEIGTLSMLKLDLESKRSLFGKKVTEIIN